MASVLCQHDNYQLLSDSDATDTESSQTSARHYGADLASSSSSSSSSSPSSSAASTPELVRRRPKQLNAGPLAGGDVHCDEHTVALLDPSELFRPETNGKALDEFRKYSEQDDDHIQQRVKRTYYTMHTNQTVDFVRNRIAKWCAFNHAELTIMEALVKLNALVDESDPDSDLPNIVHAFQTAERIRAVHPHQDWLHLTGLIHDLGKVMALWGEQQWAVVGDTFPVGCAHAASIVYREHSFDHNADTHDARYSTKYGMYTRHCGLDNVLFSWGHDEYMARVLQNHPNCSLPSEAIRIIRLHSFYPWHTGGDYMHLCNDTDIASLQLIRDFNKFDLYTKSEKVPDIDALMPYYQSLIDKYIPGRLKW